MVKQQKKFPLHKITSISRQRAVLILAICKEASFHTRFDMSSRRPKATEKVQGASIISLLQRPYGKRGLLKAILVKTRKKCTPVVIFRPFSLLCGARLANSVSNLPMVSLKKSRFTSMLL